MEASDVAGPARRQAGSSASLSLETFLVGAAPCLAHGRVTNCADETIGPLDARSAGHSGGNVTDVGWVLEYFLIALGALWAYDHPVAPIAIAERPGLRFLVGPNVPLLGVIVVAAWQVSADRPRLRRDRHRGTTTGFCRARRGRPCREVGLPRHFPSRATREASLLLLGAGRFRGGRLTALAGGGDEGQ
jgi:hypothetical protein